MIACLGSDLCLAIAYSRHIAVGIDSSHISLIAAPADVPVDSPVRCYLGSQLHRGINHFHCQISLVEGDATDEDCHLHGAGGGLTACRSCDLGLTIAYSRHLAVGIDGSHLLVATAPGDDLVGSSFWCYLGSQCHWLIIDCHIQLGLVEGDASHEHSHLHGAGSIFTACRGGDLCFTAANSRHLAVIIDGSHLLIACQPEHGIVGGIFRRYGSRQGGSACLSRACYHLQGSLIECYTLHGINQLVRPACGYTVVAVSRHFKCGNHRLRLSYLATGTGEPVLRTALGGDVVRQALDIAQLRAACKHLLIAVFRRLFCNQIGCPLKALTAVEHGLKAAVGQLVGWQLYMAEEIVYQLFRSGKQAIEGIVGIDHTVVIKEIALKHTHDVTVDLGLHSGLDVDVLRAVGYGSRGAAGSCRNPTAQGIVLAEKLHEVVLLHDDVVSPLCILGDDLFITVVDRIDDIVRQRNAATEGDGDLTVLQGHEGQRGVSVILAQLLCRRSLHDYPVGAVCRRIPVGAVLIHVYGNGSLADRTGCYLTVLIHRCHRGIIRAIGEIGVCRLGTTHTGGCLTDGQRQV